MNQIAYMIEFQRLIESLPASMKEEFLHAYVLQIKNPLLALGLDTFVGFFGIDRFYVGDIGLGILKLLTVGGLGIWILIDLILIGGRVYEKNLKLGYKIKNRMMSSLTPSRI